jgi:hypothetical protein
MELQQLLQNLLTKGGEQKQFQLPGKLFESEVGWHEERCGTGTFHCPFLIVVPFLRYITPLNGIGQTDSLKTRCLSKNCEI